MSATCTRLSTEQKAKVKELVTKYCVDENFSEFQDFFDPEQLSFKRGLKETCNRLASEIIKELSPKTKKNKPLMFKDKNNKVITSKQLGKEFEKEYGITFEA